MMAEDETKKDETTEQDAPQDEAVDQDAPQDEAPQDAGPVEAGDPPSPAVAEASSETVPPASPPASEEESADAQDDAGAEEPAAEVKEKAAEPEAEPNPEDELPWKEKRRLAKSRKARKAKPQQTPEERKAARLAERKRRGAERRKERAALKAKKTPGTGTPRAEKDSNAAKVRQGIVVSDKGQKSITVRVDIVRRHPTYEKVIRRSRTLHAHDERNEAGEGDTVRVIETRPMSKTKRWRLVEVLEKAK
jgi:small subunit ribosomal protein S17